MEPFIYASEIPLSESISLASFGPIMEKLLLNSFDISRVSVIVNPLILNDVTDVFPDFWDVNSLIVCQVFQESPACSLKLF